MFWNCSAYGKGGHPLFRDSCRVQLGIKYSVFLSGLLHFGGSVKFWLDPPVWMDKEKLNCLQFCLLGNYFHDKAFENKASTSCVSAGLSTIVVQLMERKRCHRKVVQLDPTFVTNSMHGLALSIPLLASSRPLSADCIMGCPASIFKSFQRISMWKF